MKDQEVKDKIWEKKVEMWIEDEQIFKENMRKAYAIIFDSYCGKEMQVTLKEVTDYESKVKNDPIVLLNRIKNLMHTPLRARYPYLSLRDFK